MQGNSYNKAIYYVSIFYAFIIPLSRAGIVGFSILLIVLSILEGNWKEKWNKLKGCKVFLALAIFIIYNIISLIWTNLSLESLKYISKYWYFLPAFVIFLSFPKEKSNNILTAFLFGMLISEILSYGILFEFWTLRHGTLSDPTPFMNHLDYSIFLAFTSLVLFIKVFNSGEMKEKIIYSIFFLTVSGNLFITAGRSGQLAFFVTITLLLFVRFRQNIFKFISVTIFVFTITLIIPMLLSETFKNRVLDAKEDLTKVFAHQNYESSFGNRVASWEVASDVLLKNPIIGVGNQDNIEELRVITEIKRYLFPINWFPHFHNQYLEIITALGILGLFIFLNIFYRIYKLEYLQSENNLLKISFISIFLVGFIAEPFLHKQFTMALFTIILGYLLIASKEENLSK